MGTLSHLDELEAEAIYIIREVAAECEKPVMLYSIGKDSSVMLHLALKAFYPEKPPFPFLHVNTTWKFKEMIEFRDKTAKKYGLDKPLIVQFFTYVKNLLQGDFGVSYVISKDTSISVLLKNRVPVSFGIGLEAVSFGAVVGLILGILAALKKNSWLDTICTVISVLGVSLPSYVFALVMAYFIGYKAQWLPLLFDGKKFFASSIMPMLALSMFTVATVARFTRTSLLEVLDSDYMLLAESKGITGRPLLVRHALRNALIPIITVLAPLVVDLMIGSLVIEKIFSIPGIGSLMIAAIQSNDYNVTISLAFIYSVMYIVLMLVVDVLYGIIDPRIRLAKKSD